MKDEQLTGARDPREPKLRTREGAEAVAAAATALMLRYGFAGLQQVVDADRKRPGRELSDIINAGYPLDRFESFLAALRAEIDA